MKEKTKGFLTEFKEFAMKGNVIDLAVGVIIGGAFNKIVSSLVENIIMPIIGSIIGGTDFSKLEYTLRTIDGKSTAILKYGLFIQNVFDFLIIALSIFVVIKVINKLNSIKEQPINEVVEETVVEDVQESLSVQEELLTQIRDLLKNK